MRQFRIFYSWQSDINSRLCKNFIRIALDEAAEILNNSGEFPFKLLIDSDTQGVPGTPPVNETILQKIRDCDVFVPDVTFVAKTEGGKRLPNPNVMAEYGYALHAKTHAAMLPVMNTAFGPPEDLPFDMRHLRHPTKYDAQEGIKDEERRKRRKQLAKEFAFSLRVIIEKYPPTASEKAISPDLRFHLQHLKEQDGVIHLDAPAIVSQPRCEITILPTKTVTDGVKINPRKVHELGECLVLNSHAAYRHGATHAGWWWMGAPKRISGKPNPETNWASQVARNGVVRVQFSLGRRVDDDPTIVVWGEELETRIAMVLDSLSPVAHRLQMDGPALICFLLNGMDEVELLSRKSSFSKKLKAHQILLPDLQVNSLEGPHGNELCEVFDSIWLAAGKSDGSPLCLNNQWSGYATVSGE